MLPIVPVATNVVVKFVKYVEIVNEVTGWVEFGFIIPDILKIKVEAGILLSEEFIFIK